MLVKQEVVLRGRVAESGDSLLPDESLKVDSYGNAYTQEQETEESPSINEPEPEPEDGDSSEPVHEDGAKGHDHTDADVQEPNYDPKQPIEPTGSG
jgi:hypothetical protein